MGYIDTVKPWFETSDKPTQAQFWQLFAYLRFKDEAIAIADIAGLVSALANKAEKAALESFEQGERIEFNANGFYDIAEGYLLEKIIMLPGSDAAIDIGNTAGTGDIYSSSTFGSVVSAATGEVFVVNLYAKATRRIYFTNVPVGSVIIFLRRKIRTA